MHEDVVHRDIDQEGGEHQPHHGAGKPQPLGRGAEGERNGDQHRGADGGIEVAGGDARHFGCEIEAGQQQDGQPDEQAREQRERQRQPKALLELAPDALVVASAVAVTDQRAVGEQDAEDQQHPQIPDVVADRHGREVVGAGVPRDDHVGDAHAHHRELPDDERAGHPCEPCALRAHRCPAQRAHGLSRPRSSPAPPRAVRRSRQQPQSLPVLHLPREGRSRCRPRRG